MRLGKRVDGAVGNTTASRLALRAISDSARRRVVGIGRVAASGRSGVDARWTSKSRSVHGRTKDTYLRAQYLPIKRRRGRSQRGERVFPSRTWSLSVGESLT